MSLMVRPVVVANLNSKRLVGILGQLYQCRYIRGEIEYPHGGQLEKQFRVESIAKANFGVFSSYNLCRDEIAFETQSEPLSQEMRLRM